MRKAGMLVVADEACKSVANSFWLEAFIKVLGF